jgi:hypothetical protein
MLRLLAVSLLALAACDGANAQPASKPHPSSTAASDRDLCVAMMTHARTCTAVFIPALVDARAAVDIPAGIKAAVAQDRAGVIAQANKEWANDSTDASIAASCAKPPANADELRTSATACQANTDCGAFTHCFVAIVQKSWTRP